MHLQPVSMTNQKKKKQYPRHISGPGSSEKGKKNPGLKMCSRALVQHRKRTSDVSWGSIVRKID